MTQLSKTRLSHSLEIFLSHIPPQGLEVDEKKFCQNHDERYESRLVENLLKLIVAHKYY